MKKTKKNHSALQFLMHLFQDKPDLVKVLTLGDLETQELLDRLREDDIFTEPVNFYVTGRTHAGKTTLSTKFLGRDVMPVTGMMDSTSTICYGQLQSNLRYFDLPGLSSSTKYENINRVAIGLKQLEDGSEDDIIRHLPLDDYSSAHCAPGQETPSGVRSRQIPLDQWREMQAAGRAYAPDVIVAVVAPHALFDRSDAHYFRALFTEHGERVIVVLNLWHSARGERLASDKIIEQIRSRVREAYAHACPNAAPVPIVDVDAETGHNVPLLVEQICQRVPERKVGRMQRVLRSDLKALAERQRRMNHQRTVHRIAARLAFHDVQEKWNRSDVLYEAAHSLVAYTFLTFDLEERLLEAETQKIADSLSKGVDEVHDDRKGQWKEITEVSETTRIIKKDVSRTIKEYVPKTVSERLGGFFDALFSFDLEGVLDEVFDGRRMISREIIDVVEVPVTDTTTVVTGLKNVMTGQEIRTGDALHLQGGASAVIFLLGAAMGVRDACERSELDQKQAVIDKTAHVRDQLAPHRAMIETLTSEQAGDNELQLVGLLDRLLLTPAGIA